MIRKIAVLLLAGLPTCSQFTSTSGQHVTYSSKSVCDPYPGVELVAINSENAQAFLHVWPEGQVSYIDQTPINSFQHDIRPFADPSVVNDWQLTIRVGDNVLYTSRSQRAFPCG